MLSSTACLTPVWRCRARWFRPASRRDGAAASTACSCAQANRRRHSRLNAWKSGGAFGESRASGPDSRQGIASAEHDASDLGGKRWRVHVRRRCPSGGATWEEDTISKVHNLTPLRVPDGSSSGKDTRREREEREEARIRRTPNEFPNFVAAMDPLSGASHSICCLPVSTRKRNAHNGTHDTARLEGQSVLCR
jgi:hypothetical protein